MVGAACKDMCNVVETDILQLMGVLAAAGARYGIAAELVNELLPDLKAAAASAPTSLLWPPSTGATAAHGWPHVSPHGDAALLKGHRALAGLVAVAVWLRLSSLRLLTWNHNYNVKPREISAALDNLGTSLLQVCWQY